MTSDWKQRLRVFGQRLWQPTGACMTAMPGGLGNVWSLAHWGVALQTGLATGFLAVLLTYTPARRLYRHRWGNAAVVAGLTVLGDLWSHGAHHGFPYGEAFLTGAVSGMLALAGSYLFEDRARRLRAAWRKLTGAGGRS